MTALVECVPNFSEGRDGDVLTALSATIRGVQGVHLLDVHADHWHHRSVFTFVGPPDAVLEAAFRAARTATDRIDLSTHEGVHPRIGATDVVPFVPLEGAAMDQCVSLATRLAERIGSELQIPAFLYGRAASRPERETLAPMRRGGITGLEKRMRSDPAMAPDSGPGQLHPTAGAIAVGARDVLVAFNVNLETDDVDTAERIAREIRASSGGMPLVQARGLLVAGRAQVSMNLLNIDVTPPAAVLEAIASRAAEQGTGVANSEVVGLIPERGILQAGISSLELSASTERLLLERRVRQAVCGDLDPWITRLAAGSPLPGGGAAAAMAAALAGMVSRLAMRRPVSPGSSGTEHDELAARADKLRQSLYAQAEADELAYRRFLALGERRGAEADAALAAVVAVPLGTARAAAEIAAIACRSR